MISFFLDPFILYTLNLLEGPLEQHGNTVLAATITH
jgi:hypothetical protein